MSFFDDLLAQQIREKQEKDAAAAEEAKNPSKYGRGVYADPEGLAALYRQMGGDFLSDQYAYKPDVQGVNQAAAQHTAQLLYSMPGAEEGMGGTARLSRMMQSSLPVLQQKQAALGNERQRAMTQRNQQALLALQSYGNASQEYAGNKQLQLNWDQFTEGAKLQRQQEEGRNSFGWGDVAGVIGGVAGTALGGPLGGAIGASLFGDVGKGG